MRLLAGLTFILAITDSWMLGILEQFFYPGLLLIFIIASLGIPIPEDIPLILAGVLIKTNPTVAQWHYAIPVALAGIMSGDVILYSLGRRWGRNVFEHRSVAWLVTPKRMRIMEERFHRWGVWACFFGRFMVGVRAMMCLTAGVTRFPFWKFFLADFSGALLSAPFFMFLGYKFAEKLPDLYDKVEDAQFYLFLGLGIIVACVVLYEVRRLRKLRREDAADTTSVENSANLNSTPVAPDSTMKPLAEKSSNEVRIPPVRHKAMQGNV